MAKKLPHNSSTCNTSYAASYSVINGASVTSSVPITTTYTSSGVPYVISSSGFPHDIDTKPSTPLGIRSITDLNGLISSVLQNTSYSVNPFIADYPHLQAVADYLEENKTNIIHKYNIKEIKSENYIHPQLYQDCERIYKLSQIYS